MKIAVITTGGTIGCVPDGGVLRPSADIAPLLEAAARCGAPSAEYDVLPLMNVLSENLGGSDIVRIAEVVTAALASSDGAVVTHGTDTLDVTAAALAFALGSECAPVALASAFRPLSAQDSDAPLCFAACAAVAASGMRGVYACSASGPLTAAVHYGVRLMPFAPYSDAMYSLGGHAAMFRGGVLEQCHVPVPPPDMPPRDISALALPSDVMFVAPTSLLSLPEPPEGVRKVVFALFHSATLPSSRADFVAFCRRCSSRGISLYALGASPSAHYASMDAFADLGITVLPRVAPAAAAVALRIGAL